MKLVYQEILLSKAVPEEALGLWTSPFPILPATGLTPATPISLIRCQRGLDPPQSVCTCAFLLPAPQARLNSQEFLAAVPGKARLARWLEGRRRLLYGLDLLRCSSGMRVNTEPF
ncbi:unnamed protein product [Lota lota]